MEGQIANPFEVLYTKIANLETVVLRLENKLIEKENDPYKDFPEMVNKKQAKEILNIRSNATIDGLVKQGKVKKYKNKNGHSVRFKKSELIVFFSTWKKYQR